MDAKDLSKSEANITFINLLNELAIWLRTLQHLHCLLTQVPINDIRTTQHETKTARSKSVQQTIVGNE